MNKQILNSLTSLHQPEIIEYELSVQDKIVVLASDGLWEFVSNKDVIKLVAPYYSRRDLEGACEVLMQEALRRWMQESQVIDDITIIVIFINSWSSCEWNMLNRIIN